MHLLELDDWSIAMLGRHVQGLFLNLVEHDIRKINFSPWRSCLIYTRKYLRIFYLKRISHHLDEPSHTVFLLMLGHSQLFGHPLVPVTAREGWKIVDMAEYCCEYAIPLFSKLFREEPPLPPSSTHKYPPSEFSESFRQEPSMFSKATRSSILRN